MKQWISGFLFLVFGHIGLHAQSDYPWLRSGDKLLDDGSLADAETAYRKAMEANPKASTQYNLGNTIHRQQRIPEAILEYQKAIESSSDPAIQSKAYYNLGNAQFESQQFEESIKAYKESLKLNPEDDDAKKNLMLAMRQLRKQQEQQQPKDQQQQQQQPREDVNKDEANEILKAIEREDQRVQEKLKKSAGKTPPPVKDW